MRFALLGFDPDSWALAQAVATAGSHELVWGSLLQERESQFRALAPAATISDEWEPLLLRSASDAVIVGRAGDDEQRADMLRKLVQEAVPLLTVHPIHDSMLVYYELDMIRRESQGLVVPYLPWRLHPAVLRLRGLVDSENAGELGSIEQLVVERTLLDRGKRNVAAQFARDADLVRYFCGEQTKLNAMAPPGGVERYAHLCVQLSSEQGGLSRWTVEPASDVEGARFTFLASGGKASLSAPASGAWRLDWQAKGGMASEDFRDWNGPSEAIEAFSQAVAGEAPHGDWIDAARSVELADTIERSLAKGRVIELHYDDYTEEATFKGLMTSLGCGLLLLAIVALPAAAVADRLGLPWGRFVVLGMIVVFGLFLLLQFLRPNAPTGKSAAIDPGT